MNKERFNLLVDKLNSGTISDHELVEYSALLNQITSGNQDWDIEHLGSEEEVKAELFQMVEAGVLKRKTRHLNLWRCVAAAAAIIIFLSVGSFFLQREKKQTIQQVAKRSHTDDIAPGGNKAIITLDDGSTIVLNGAKVGKLARQGNTQLRKTANGQISYVSLQNNSNSKNIVYNTATTPRGGQYQFILSDGTKVWLNAASSIKYPVEFHGKERKVELTGEAYFEVAHDAKMPFRVVSNGQIVEVLGTHFNINAYNDEDAVKTTLLEGSVKVSAGGISNIIKPGEQAKFKHGAISVREVDLDEALAWKNGFFYFKDDNIQGVMKELARWYDVEVKYEGALPSRALSGEIPRNVNASQILDILTFKKIHYKIEGKTIVVTP
jgi:ferric-dicitrate binding protein FerR (iron transport regulator)